MPRERHTPNETGRRQDFWMRACFIVADALERGRVELAREAFDLAALFHGWRVSPPSSEEFAVAVQRYADLSAKLRGAHAPSDPPTG